jgi:hypothetical protein
MRQARTGDNGLGRLDLHPLISRKVEILAPRLRPGGTMPRTMPDLPATTRRTALEALCRDALARLTERFDTSARDDKQRGDA